MGNSSRGKSKWFLKLLGVLLLLGGIALIVVGGVFIYPNIKTFSVPEELYYIFGGVCGFFIGIIFLMSASKRAWKKAYINANEKAKDEYTSKNEFTDADTWSSSDLTLSDVSDSWVEPMEKEKETVAEPVRVKEKKYDGPGVICYKCKTPNNSIDYYCCNCKSALKKVCPFCGHGNSPNAAACEGCSKIF